MKVSFRLSNKGQPILEFQNETFYRHRSGKCTPIVTWRCVRYNQKCQARLKTIDDEIVGNATVVHSHGTFGMECASQNYDSESDETVSNSSQSEETKLDGTASSSSESIASETDKTESNASETDETECNASEADDTESNASDRTEYDATETDNTQSGS